MVLLADHHIDWLPRFSFKDDGNHETAFEENSDLYFAAMGILSWDDGGSQEKENKHPALVVSEQAEAIFKYNANSVLGCLYL